MNAADTRIHGEVRRQVQETHERVRVIQRRVLDLHDQVALVSRRVSGAAETIRWTQSGVDLAARRNVGPDVALEMEEARRHGQRAYTIGLEVLRELERVQSSLAEVKRDVDEVDWPELSLQGRVDLVVLSLRVENMAWSVALARPAAAAVTESMLYAVDRARVIQEQALVEVPPLNSPAVFAEINSDLNRAVEGEAHLQSATSDSLRLAETAGEHRELVAEEAQARIAGEQERDIPLDLPEANRVGLPW